MQYLITYFDTSFKRRFEETIADPLINIQDKLKDLCTLFEDIVVREDWLWKTTNIKYKNNGAVVYVGSSLKVHNPLFSIGKL